MIYELINPSDKITFIANDDQCAFFVTVILGKGKYGCQNIDTGKSMETILMFASERQIDETINQNLGSSLSEFLKKRKDDVINSLKSFAYLSGDERRIYDSACEAITDPDKLNEFKSKHEDHNRTSMSRIVKSAWMYAEKLEGKDVVYEKHR